MCPASAAWRPPCGGSAHPSGGDARPAESIWGLRPLAPPATVARSGRAGRGWGMRATLLDGGIVARGVQRAALAGAGGGVVADAAPRPAALAHRLPPCGGSAPRAAAPGACAGVLDSRTLATPESGGRAGVRGETAQGQQSPPRGPGQFLALHITPANEQDRAQVGPWRRRCRRPPASTSLAYVDQGYTGDRPATAAAEQGMAGSRHPRRSSAASCCCRDAGWWSAPSTGPLPPPRPRLGRRARAILMAARLAC